MRSRFWAIAIFSTVLAVSVIQPVSAQIPFLTNLQTPSIFSNVSANKFVSGWVYLDGRRVFRIAAPSENFTERLQDVQQNLTQISQEYQNTSSELNVQIRQLNGLPVIYVNNQYLLTITDQDAKLQQLEPSKWAVELSQILQQDLKRAKRERQPQFLARQGKIATGTGLVMILMSCAVYCWQRRSIQERLKPIDPTDSSVAKPIKTQLSQQQHRHLKEVKRRLFQSAQAVIWGGGTLIILGMFPYTRFLQVWIFTVLQIPLSLGIVGLGTYLLIRLSYVLIDRFTSALVTTALLTPEETAQRLQLRVSTISGVTKSIATFACVVIGTLLALMVLSINIAPLLAGAGLIGVAISLASQNLIKDAINGFLIILEDQYALGDVIAVGNFGGKVENLNLRITQLRDAEGRLITIPNSEVKIVANLSSRWSQVDINIPVAYNTDVNQALKLIEAVALEMDHDPQWQDQILETPQVLGVETFGDRGLMIRVWIKTQPLKQWDVAREYRRRLKVAFDQAGILIPLPQQSVWVNDSRSVQSKSDGTSTSN